MAALGDPAIERGRAAWSSSLLAERARSEMCSFDARITRIDQPTLQGIDESSWEGKRRSGQGALYCSHRTSTIKRAASCAQKGPWPLLPGETIRMRRYSFGECSERERWRSPVLAQRAVEDSPRWTRTLEDQSILPIPEEGNKRCLEGSLICTVKEQIWLATPLPVMEKDKRGAKIKEEPLRFMRGWPQTRTLS